MGRLTRRQVLRGAAAGGALLVTRPAGVLAQPLPSLDAYGTPRRSRLFPDQLLVHTDLHNHSLFSDGDGDPDAYYGLMRETGVDVAALTDHSTLSASFPQSPCGTLAPFGQEQECLSVAGLHDGTWEDNKALADRHDVEGDFTAIAGFEWSSPTLGHVNVWFSEHFTDPLHTGGLGDPADLLAFAESEGFPVPAGTYEAMKAVIDATPGAGAGMAAFWAWLKGQPLEPTNGDGADALFGFNHPGREPGRFQEFLHDADLVQRCVSMELFNKDEDYLFELTDVGRPSPLVACLDAGWRPGILGTSDYHGTDFGTPDDRGRAGMYVGSLSRASVREAMEARRFFATRIKGLRLDATANGARMGTTLGHTRGDVRIRLDLDRGPQWYGRQVRVAVLATGSVLPTLVDVVDVTVPTPDEPVVEFTVPWDVADGRWLVLRLTDPAVPAEGVATGDFASLGRAFAYASPFFLDPDAPAPSPLQPEDAPAPTPPPAPPLPATGGGAAALGALAMGAAGLLGLRSRRATEHDHRHDADGHAHD